MRSPRALLHFLLMLVFGSSLASASLVWRPGEGWSDESGGDISASSSRDQLTSAQKLEAQGQRDDAMKAYKSLLRKWPLSFFAPEAQFRVGKIQEDEADFYDAFKSFQTMVKKYPSSTYFEQALGEQFRIANLYLAGEPQRIWKIPVGPSMDKTVDMYNQIIKNAPYGAYAAQSQFNIGQAREQQRKYTDAVDAYQKVLDSYPTSSVATNAQYQMGYAWMRAASNSNYDQSAARKAIDSFQDYLVRYPNSDKAGQAQDNIEKLSHEQTQGAYNIAKFYETQHDTRAAYIYYNEVVREDPNGANAQQAKKRIQQLRPVVEAMPGGAGPDGTPAPAAPLAPTTSPIDTTPLPQPSTAGTPDTSSAPGADVPGDHKPTNPADALPLTEPSGNVPDPGTANGPPTLTGLPGDTNAAAGTPSPAAPTSETPSPASTPADSTSGAPATNAAPASPAPAGTPLPQ